jgi:hypothetical protein
MSSQYPGNEIHDTKQLVKILNDTKEYFGTIQRDELSENVKMRYAISTILDVACDTVEVDLPYVKQCSESSIFALDDAQKVQFIDDVKNYKTIDIEEKYMDAGISQFSLLLESVVVPSIKITSNGSAYCGSVMRYELQLKPYTMVRDIFDICRKIMDHDAHCIQAVQYMGPDQIHIVVDEST